MSVFIGDYLSVAGLTGGGIPTSIKVCEKITDFGIPDGNGIITPDTTKIHWVGKSFPISPYRIVVPAGQLFVIQGTEADLNIISSTTTSALITFDDAVVIARNVGFSCPNGRIFSCAGTNGLTGLLVESQCTYAGASFPNLFNNMSIVAAFECRYANMASGVHSFSGSSFGEFLNLSVNYSNNNIGVLLNLNNAVFSAFDFINNRVVSTASNTLISSSGAQDSNVKLGAVGKISGTRTVGSVPNMVGVGINNNRWDFRGNNLLNNSSISCKARLTADRTIVINSPGVYVDVDGVNWVGDVVNRFSVTTGGVLTYTFELSSVIMILVKSTVDLAVANTDRISQRILVNGVQQDESRVNADSDISLVSSTVITLNKGDVIKLQTANLDTDRDIIFRTNSSISAIAAM